jgi:hypothetical protein
MYPCAKYYAYTFLLLPISLVTYSCKLDMMTYDDLYTTHPVLWQGI